ncbi:hypothetical protein GYMLUDRAFT_125946, partial [Collybiopsis luxurians FD-317 M1]
MIQFVDGKPTGIYYSQHSDGQGFGWDDPEVSKQDGRPIVYSALRSHANYASSGSHIHDDALIDYCDAGYKWDPILSAYFYQLEPTSNFTLTPLTTTIESASTYPTSFLYYTGRWGDDQYPDSDPRQKTVPYFNLKRFNAGPTGPRTKDLLRKGLFP